MDVELVELSCWCGLPFAMPVSLHREVMKAGVCFHCPLGHSNVYPEKARKKYLKKLEREEKPRDDLVSIDGGKVD